MGTDFSLEDIVPREIENSSQQRRADTETAGQTCFVVDVVPKGGTGSQYSKLRLFVEKNHYVPIQTRYWSHDDVEVKQYTAPADQIEEIEGVWMIRQGTMRDLVNKSYTTARILEIEPNAKIKDSEFSERSLIGRSR
jgi:outer membrane lipoprotein-sorting protein